MNRNRKQKFWGIGKLLFWSLGKLRLSNLSVLFSLLPLLIGGFFTAVTESKAEARHKTRPVEECCVVAQSFPSESSSQIDANSVELAQFPDGFYGQFYRVYVPTYSDELLQIVQQEVTSSAYRAVYRGRQVIIVTQNDLGRARRAVRDLQRRGITAQMEAVRSNQFSPNSGNFLPEDNRYIVYVLIGRRQNRYALLDRVQFFDPDARVQRLGRRTVIVVRELDNRNDAQRLVNDLQSNGLSGRIYVRPIESEFSSNQNRFAGVEVEPEIPNNVDRFTPTETQETVVTTAPETSYKLVIPIDRDELAAIEAQVRQMAIDLGQANDILIEANPDRSELIIGPFNNLQTAQQWEGYLQEYGVMNALIR